MLVVCCAQNDPRARIGQAHAVALLGVRDVRSKLLESEAGDAVVAVGNPELLAEARREHFERAELDELRNEVARVVREAKVIFRNLLGRGLRLAIVILHFVDNDRALAHLRGNRHAPNVRGGVKGCVVTNYLRHHVRAP